MKLEFSRQIVQKFSNIGFHENPPIGSRVLFTSNIEEPTRCNNNNLLISKISSTCFGQSFAHLQERKTEIFTAHGIVSCCCSRQGFGERQCGTMWHTNILTVQNTFFECGTLWYLTSWRCPSHDSMYGVHYTITDC